MYGNVQDVLRDKGTQVYTTGPRVSVRDAVRAMNEKGVGALLVMEAGRLVGIFTERDVLARVVDPGRAPGLTSVGEVMTRDVMTVTPDLPVSEAMEIMTLHRRRHLPVVHAGAVAGMISIGDLLRRVSVEQQAEIGKLTDYIRGPVA